MTINRLFAIPALGDLAGLPRGPIGAMLKAREWTSWLTVNAHHLAQSEPSVRFVVAATLRLHQATIRHARWMRDRPRWDVNGSVDLEDVPIVKQAEQELAWFERHKPAELMLPEWGTFLVTALHGAYRQMVRQAKEIDQTRRRGFLLLNVAPFDDTLAAERAEEQP